MPYISPTRRADIDNGTDAPDTEGELNYALSMVMIRYLKKKGVSYATFNAIIGAVEGAKLEFERRVVFPYEDIKIRENGDIY